MGLRWSTQRANSTDGSTLQAVVANESFPTFYGDLTFDANGQNSAGALLLQYDGTGEEVQTVYPLEAASMSLVYPAPSWGWRDCIKGGNCSFPFGQCTADGECDCRGAFVANYEDGQYACDAPEDITYGCGAGEYYTATDTDTDSFTCTSCEAGSYQPDSNSLATQCIPCELGYFSPEAGAANCGACANGQVALKPGSLECEACPDGAVCKDSSSLTVKRGNWRPPGSLYDVFECPSYDNCLETNTTFGFDDDADADACAEGSGGVLCAVCQPNYVKQLELCENCDDLSSAGVTAFAAAIVMAIGVVLFIRSSKYRAMVESVSLSVEFRIYFATIQILASYAALLSSVLFEPLESFLSLFSFSVDISWFLGGVGASCANYELRSFKYSLVLSTLLPIGLGFGIVLAFVSRVFVLKHDFAQMFRVHVAAALLLMYIVLPSTSVKIFMTFSCDERELGVNGETYLMADYAGSSRTIQVLMNATDNLTVDTCPRWHSEL